MFLQALRYELSYPRTSIQLCLLGIVGGCCSAALIILFRLSIESIQISVLGAPGNYFDTSPIVLLFLPLIAVCIMIVSAKLTNFKQGRLGIPYVIHRFKLFYGHIPFKTKINQFVGGVCALASGFVVGKEGPSVHIATAGSHLIGSYLRLPYNSLRILTACGISAGISAAFNTPFAAVIFVMEVVLREYKIHIFIPVMLSASCGTVMTRLVFGNEQELSFLDFQGLETGLLIYLIFFGFCIGLLGALFNKQLMMIMKVCKNWSISKRFLLAAIMTGCVGYLVPNALGAEFANIQRVFSSDFPFVYLCLIFILKFVLANVALGLGIPGGIVGATMAIGMLAGVILLQPLYIVENADTYVSTFALLGLAAMLTSVLHAPMAALSAAMELSASPESIMPCMIVIVSAYVTSRQLCKNRSIFIQQLDFQELKYTTSSIRDVLQTTGVLAKMRTDFAIFKDASDTRLYAQLQAKPQQLLINQISSDNETRFELVELNVSLENAATPISTYEIKGISSQSTMAEVYELLQKEQQGAVYIFDTEVNQPTGLITWNILNAYLLHQRH